ncbi:MAG: hypothetical protein J5J00_07975 [Deltaproteobacteria bacterium]|nr:hypothetical protein [Deltaproteobacteria bacterium]
MQSEIAGATKPEEQQQKTPKHEPAVAQLTQTPEQQNLNYTLAVTGQQKQALRAVINTAQAQHDFVATYISLVCGKKQKDISDSEIEEVLRKHPELRLCLRQLETIRKELENQAHKAGQLSSESKATLEVALKRIANYLEGKPISPEVRLGDRTPKERADALEESLKSLFGDQWNDQIAELAQEVYKEPEAGLFNDAKLQIALVEEGLPMSDAEALMDSLRRFRDEAGTAFNPLKAVQALAAQVTDNPSLPAILNSRQKLLLPIERWLAASDLEAGRQKALAQIISTLLEEATSTLLNKGDALLSAKEGDALLQAAQLALQLTPSQRVFLLSVRPELRNHPGVATEMAPVVAALLEHGELSADQQEAVVIAEARRLGLQKPGRLTQGDPDIEKLVQAFPQFFSSAQAQLKFNAAVKEGEALHLSQKQAEMCAALEKAGLRAEDAEMVAAAARQLSEAITDKHEVPWKAASAFRDRIGTGNDSLALMLSKHEEILKILHEWCDAQMLPAAANTALKASFTEQLTNERNNLASLAEHFGNITRMASPLSNIKGHLDRMDASRREAIIKLHPELIKKCIESLSPEDAPLVARIFTGQSITDEEAVKFLEREAVRVGTMHGRLIGEGAASDSLEVQNAKGGYFNFSGGFTELYKKDPALEKRITTLFENTSNDLATSLKARCQNFQHILSSDPSPKALQTFLDNLPEEHAVSIVRAFRAELVKGLDESEIARVDELLKTGRISKQTIEVLAFKRFAEVLAQERAKVLASEDGIDDEALKSINTRLAALAEASKSTFGVESPITKHIEASVRRAEDERRAFEASKAIYYFKKREVLLDGTFANDSSKRDLREYYQGLGDLFRRYPQLKAKFDQHIYAAQVEQQDLRARCTRWATQIYNEAEATFVCSDGPVMQAVRGRTPEELATIRTLYNIHYPKSHFWSRLEDGLSQDNWKELRRIFRKEQMYTEGKQLSLSSLREIFKVENKLVVTDALLSGDNAKVAAVALNDAITTSSDPALAALEALRTSGVHPREQREAHQEIYGSDVLQALEARSQKIPEDPKQATVAQKKDAKGAEIVTQALEKGKVDLQATADYIALRTHESASELGELEGAEKQDKRQIEALQADNAEAQQLSRWIYDHSKQFEEKINELFSNQRSQSRLGAVQQAMHAIGVEIGVATHFEPDKKIGEYAASQRIAHEARLNEYTEAQKVFLEQHEGAAGQLEIELERSKDQGRKIGINIDRREHKFWNAVDGLGTTEDKAYEGLRNGSGSEAVWMGRLFHARHDETIGEAIAGDFSGSEQDKAFAISDRDTVAEAAASADIAMSAFFGPKIQDLEGAVSLVQDDLGRERFNNTFADQYAGHYHHAGETIQTDHGSYTTQGPAATSFSDALSIVTRYADKKAVLGLLAGDQAAADAAHILKAMQDKEGIGQVIAGMRAPDGHIDAARITAAVERYQQENSSQPLESALAKLESKEEQKIVLAVLDKNLTPEQLEIKLAVLNIRAALNIGGILNGDDDIIRGILSAPEDIRKRYEELWKKSPTDLNEQEKKELEALKAKITEWAAFNQKVAEEYQKQYGTSLVSHFDRCLSGHNSKVVQELLTSANLSLEWQLWDSMHGAGTTTAPNLILKGISMERAKEVRAAFDSEWGDLVKWIEGDCGGDERWDAKWELEGHSDDPNRELERRRRRFMHETAGEYVKSGLIASDEVERMRADLTELQRAVTLGDKAKFELFRDRFDVSADATRETVDATIQSIQNTTTMVIMIGGTVVVVVGSGGTLSGAALAGWGTFFAVSAGGYRVVIGIGGKGWEGFGHEKLIDEGVHTLIDVGAGYAALGVSKVIPVGQIVGDGMVTLVGRRGAQSGVVILSEEGAELSGKLLGQRLVQNSRVLRMTTGSIQGALDGAVFAPIDAGGRAALADGTWDEGFGQGLLTVLSNAGHAIPQGLQMGAGFGVVAGARTPKHIKLARAMSEGDASSLRTSGKIKGEGLKLLQQRESSQGFVTNGDAAEALLASKPLSAKDSKKLIETAESKLGNKPPATEAEALARYEAQAKEIDLMKARFQENGVLTEFDAAIVNGKREHPGFAIITEKEMKARMKAGEERVKQLEEKLAKAPESEHQAIREEIELIQKRSEALSDQLQKYQEAMKQAEPIKELVVFEEKGEGTKEERSSKAETEEKKVTAKEEPARTQEQPTPEKAELTESSPRPPEPGTADLVQSPGNELLTKQLDSARKMAGEEGVHLDRTQRAALKAWAGRVQQVVESVAAKKLNLNEAQAKKLLSDAADIAGQDIRLTLAKLVTRNPVRTVQDFIVRRSAQNALKKDLVAVETPEIRAKARKEIYERVGVTQDQVITSENAVVRDHINSAIKSSVKAETSTLLKPWHRAAEFYHTTMARFAGRNLPATPDAVAKQLRAVESELGFTPEVMDAVAGTPMERSLRKDLYAIAQGRAEHRGISPNDPARVRDLVTKVQHEIGFVNEQILVQKKLQLEAAAAANKTARAGEVRKEIYERVGVTQDQLITGENPAVRDHINAAIKSSVKAENSTLLKPWHRANEFYHTAMAKFAARNLPATPEAVAVKLRAAEAELGFTPEVMDAVAGTPMERSLRKDLYAIAQGRAESRGISPNDPPRVRDLVAKVKHEIGFVNEQILVQKKLQLEAAAAANKTARTGEVRKEIYERVGVTQDQLITGENPAVRDHINAAIKSSVKAESSTFLKPWHRAAEFYHTTMARFAARNLPATPEAVAVRLRAAEAELGFTPEVMDAVAGTPMERSLRKDLYAIAQGRAEARGISPNDPPRVRDLVAKVQHEIGFVNEQILVQKKLQLEAAAAANKTARTAEVRKEIYERVGVTQDQLITGENPAVRDHINAATKSAVKAETSTLLKPWHRANEFYHTTMARFAARNLPATPEAVAKQLKAVEAELGVTPEVMDAVAGTPMERSLRKDLYAIAQGRAGNRSLSPNDPPRVRDLVAKVQHEIGFVNEQILVQKKLQLEAAAAANKTARTGEVRKEIYERVGVTQDQLITGENPAVRDHINAATKSAVKAETSTLLKPWHRAAEFYHTTMARFAGRNLPATPEAVAVKLRAVEAELGFTPEVMDAVAGTPMERSLRKDLYAIAQGRAEARGISPNDPPRVRELVAKVQHEIGFVNEQILVQKKLQLEAAAAANKTARTSEVRKEIYERVGVTQDQLITGKNPAVRDHINAATRSAVKAESSTLLKPWHRANEFYHTTMARFAARNLPATPEAVAKHLKAVEAELGVTPEVMDAVAGTPMERSLRKDLYAIAQGRAEARGISPNDPPRVRDLVAKVQHEIGFVNEQILVQKKLQLEAAAAANKTARTGEVRKEIFDRVGVTQDQLITGENPAVRDHINAATKSAVKAESSTFLKPWHRAVEFYHTTMARFAATNLPATPEAVAVKLRAVEAELGFTPEVMDAVAGTPMERSLRKDLYAIAQGRAESRGISPNDPPKVRDLVAKVQHEIGFVNEQILVQKKVHLEEARAAEKVAFRAEKEAEVLGKLKLTKEDVASNPAVKARVDATVEAAVAAEGSFFKPYHKVREFVHGVRAQFASRAVRYERAVDLRTKEYQRQMDDAFNLLAEDSGVKQFDTPSARSEAAQKAARFEEDARSIRGLVEIASHPGRIAEYIHSRKVIRHYLDSPNRHLAYQTQDSATARLLIDAGIATPRTQVPVQAAANSQVVPQSDPLPDAAHDTVAREEPIVPGPKPEDAKPQLLTESLLAEGSEPATLIKDLPAKLQDSILEAHAKVQDLSIKAKDSRYSEGAREIIAEELSKERSRLFSLADQADTVRAQAVEPKKPAAPKTVPEAKAVEVVAESAPPASPEEGSLYERLLRSGSNRANELLTEVQDELREAIVKAHLEVEKYNSILRTKGDTYSPAARQLILEELAQARMRMSELCEQVQFMQKPSFADGDDGYWGNDGPDDYDGGWDSGGGGRSGPRGGGPAVRDFGSGGGGAAVKERTALVMDPPAQPQRSLPSAKPSKGAQASAEPDFQLNNFDDIPPYRPGADDGGGGVMLETEVAVKTVTEAPPVDAPEIGYSRSAGYDRNSPASIEKQIARIERRIEFNERIISDPAEYQKSRHRGKTIEEYRESVISDQAEIALLKAELEALSAAAAKRAAVVETQPDTLPQDPIDAEIARKQLMIEETRALIEDPAQRAASREADTPVEIFEQRIMAAEAQVARLRMKQAEARPQATLEAEPLVVNAHDNLSSASSVAPRNKAVIYPPGSAYVRTAPIPELQPAVRPRVTPARAVPEILPRPEVAPFLKPALQPAVVATPRLVIVHGALAPRTLLKHKTDLDQKLHPHIHPQPHHEPKPAVKTAVKTKSKTENDQDYEIFGRARNEELKRKRELALFKLRDLVEIPEDQFNKKINYCHNTFHTALPRVQKSLGKCPCCGAKPSWSPEDLA